MLSASGSIQFSQLDSPLGRSNAKRCAGHSANAGPLDEAGMAVLVRRILRISLPMYRKCLPRAASPKFRPSIFRSPLDCVVLAVPRVWRQRCSLDAFCASIFQYIGNAFRERLYPTFAPRFPARSLVCAALAARRAGYLCTGNTPGLHEQVAIIYVHETLLGAAPARSSWYIHAPRPARVVGRPWGSARTFLPRPYVRSACPALPK